MRRNTSIKFRFCACISIFLCWKIISMNYHTQKQMIIRLERLHNYKPLVRTDKILDTYYHRITRFLNERNVSIQSYEQVDATNAILQKDINTKIADLRTEVIQELKNIRNDKELQRGCQKSCCWSQRKTKEFYSGEKNRSPSILDRISQIDMKLLADVHYGDLPIPDDVQLTELTLDLLPCLQNNTVIFVDTTSLGKFFNEIHNKISVNYILITGDSDIACPLRIRGPYTQLLNKIFAGETRIVHWFAMNCNLGRREQWKNAKIFSCIPQGIDQWSDHRYYMEIVNGKDDSVYNTDLKTNDYWLLTSFTVEHAKKYRKPLWKLSCSGRLKSISKCFYRSYSIDLWRYFIHLAQSKFVLSPPGDGMDCYRTWEAIYLGSIPIVISSTINSLYQDLPVLVVNNYEEITSEFLEKTYKKMINQTYDFRRLYKGYWQKKINSYRNASELIQIYYTYRI